MLKNHQDIAAALYDGGWRKEDKKWIMEEYGLTEEDATRICSTLDDYEKEGGTKMTMKTIQEFAREAADYFTTDCREDGTEYNKINDYAPDWVFELVRTAHDDMLPDDNKYRFVEYALELIADNTDDDLDCPYIEPDSYTSDLTSWLNSDVRRVYYLDEILSEYAIKDGFSLLAHAQMREKEEVYFLVLEFLRSM